MSSIWRLFISRRFAVGLLIIISVMLFLGVLLPSLSYHTEEEMELFRQQRPVLFKLGSTFDPPNLVNSWAFIILNTLLFASTISCAIERIRNREFADPYAGAPEYFRRRSEFRGDERPDAIGERAKVLLKANRWRQIEMAQDHDKVAVMGQKGRFGFWGSIIFHLAFLIMLAGAIISANTRLNATMLITEGQSLQVDEAAFATVAKRPENLELPPLSLKLNKVDVVWAKDAVAADYTAWLDLADDMGRTTAETVKVNQAMRHKKIAFIFENFGYAPKFRATDRSGKIIFEGFINLDGREPGSKDSFVIPERDIEVGTSFLPNKNDRQSLEPLNPVYYLIVKEAGKQIFEGPIEPGKPVEVGDLDLDFVELRKWVYFRITRDYGVDILFWGFVISFVGFAVRFFLHDRTMKVTITAEGSGSRVVVSGKSRYFPELFQAEIARLTGRLSGTKQRVT